MAHRLSITLPDDLWDALTLEAADDDRSVSSLIVRRLTRPAASPTRLVDKLAGRSIQPGPTEQASQRPGVTPIPKGGK